MLECRTPNNEQEFSAYFDLRWQILRSPWQQPVGSERDEFENQASHRIVVNEHGTVIAVGRFHKISQHQGQIRYMAVAPEYRGQGVGEKLLSSLEECAQKQGVTLLTLNARELALNFYTKLGYSQGEYQGAMFGEIKHFKMTKTLTQPLQHQQDNAQQLQDTWHQTIPLSQAMNMAINYFDGESLYTSCDLTFNKNLHNTMFAGSIYTIATLTGWGWVYLQLQSLNISADIVLADANIRYHAPIAGSGFAVTHQHLVEGTFAQLKSQSKTKIKITVHVFCGDTIAATFSGIYFAKLK